MAYVLGNRTLVLRRLVWDCVALMAHRGILRAVILILERMAFSSQLGLDLRALELRRVEIILFETQWH